MNQGQKGSRAYKMKRQYGHEIPVIVLGQSDLSTLGVLRNVSQKGDKLDRKAIRRDSLKENFFRGV